MALPFYAVVLAAALGPLPASPAPSATPAATVTPAATAAPTLSAAPAQVNLNPAQQQVVQISGAVAPVTATLDRKLVTVVVDPNATLVTITATQATGGDVLHLTDARGSAVDVPIRVAFNAGTIVPDATLQVTGNPADATWLNRTALASVVRLTRALPGATATVEPATLPALSSGQSAQAAYNVSIDSPDGRYFPVRGTTTLAVSNVPVQAFAPSLLMYDDDPEHITQDGVLFRGTIAPDAPAGLYYYHDDGADPHRLVVALTTTGAPATVQVIDASAGPNIDVMQVGHAVSRTFLAMEPSGEGIVVPVTPASPQVLHDVSLIARQGAAGNLYLRVLSGGPVTVTVAAVPSAAIDLDAALNGPQLPSDGHHRSGIFRLAGFGNATLQYAAGGPDAKLVVGDTDPTPPAADSSATGHDYGDYGVLRTIQLDLNNPTASPATAYLYFRPIGGIARANFTVGATPVELGCVRSPVPYQVAAFALQPGQRAMVPVLTMTDGGSFYPAEIGVTGTAPQPAAPPMNAPDGCFPKP